MRRYLVWPLMLAFVGACGRSGELEFPAGIRLSTKIVDATADVGFYADLELDADNVPAIAYYDYTNGDLKFARLNMSTGEWELTVIDEDGDVGGWPDLAYDSFNNPHIAYYDYTNGKIKYAFFNGLEWVVRTLDLPGEWEGYLAMQLDRNNVAHIAAISAGRFNLEYIVYDPQADAFAGRTVDEGTRTTGFGGNINQEVALVLRRVGDEELPVIGYYHASYGLLQIAYLERRPDGTLAFRLRVLDGSTRPTAADVGQFVSMTLEDDDVLHLAYYDATQQDLLYGRYQFSTDEMIRERVDTDGVVGETSSIILDAEGRPTISYFDSTNNDLKLAIRHPDGRWRRYRVDLRGVVGTFSSMRLMRDGQLGIAYRDSGREALKFALVRTN